MDSSDNFEIIGVLMLRSKDKEAWLRAFRDKKLHLRELKRADKRRISGRMLSLLRDRLEEDRDHELIKELSQFCKERGWELTEYRFTWHPVDMAWPASRSSTLRIKQSIIEYS